MNLLKKTIAVCALAGYFPLSAVADEWTVSAIPTNLHVYNSAGDTYVDHVAKGCVSSLNRYRIPVNHPKYDTIVSILLAAQMAQKEVILKFNGCEGNIGMITGVYLRD